jgi:hypothetical protein
MDYSVGIPRLPSRSKPGVLPQNADRSYPHTGLPETSSALDTKGAPIRQAGPEKHEKGHRGSSCDAGSVKPQNETGRLRQV